jgi:hypothetical protein
LTQCRILYYKYAMRNGPQKRIDERRHCRRAGAGGWTKRGSQAILRAGGGAPNKATLAAAALVDGEALGWTRRAVEAALAGDTLAMKLCLERAP